LLRVEMSINLRDLGSITPATPSPAPAQPARTGAKDPHGFATALEQAAASTGGAAAPESKGSTKGTPSTAPATTTPASTTPASRTPASTTPASTSGEQLEAVPGAPYAKITSGADAGLYLNEAAGNPREGQAFRLEQRGDRWLHVYGSGAGEVIEVIVHHAAKNTGSPSATTTTGGSTTTGNAGTTTGGTTTGTAAPSTTGHGQSGA
jgi:hypothetical protein